MRVQIPAYTDRWMMGDRYGEVISTHLTKSKKTGDEIEVAVVEMDKSGRVIRVVLDDCQVI